LISWPRAIHPDNLEEGSGHMFSTKGLEVPMTVISLLGEIAYAADEPHAAKPQDPIAAKLEIARKKYRAKMLRLSPHKPSTFAHRLATGREAFAPPDIFS